MAEAQGLISIRVAGGADAAATRLEAAIAAKGLTVFAKVDHAAGARQAGLSMRPTLLHMFGNPRGGTPLMLIDQRLGIDLPLKVLTWEDEAGQVWLTYVDPAWIARMRGLGDAGAETTRALSHLLAALIAEAAQA